jgi:hypothetical protein
VYTRAGSGGNSEQDEKREKAVRKVVRALIEKAGGNGEEAKKRIDAKYRWGAVWWHGDDAKWQKVAQWSATDRKMTMLGAALDLQPVVDELLQ